MWGGGGGGIKWIKTYGDNKVIACKNELMPQPLCLHAVEQHTIRHPTMHPYGRIIFKPSDLPFRSNGWEKNPRRKAQISLYKITAPSLAETLFYNTLSQFPKGGEREPFSWISRFGSLFYFLKFMLKFLSRIELFDLFHIRMCLS